MYQKPANGAGEEQLLYRSTEQKYPQDWSPDGRYLLFIAITPIWGSDLLMLPLEGDRKPVPYHVSPFREFRAQFSPNGKWVAFVSDEFGHPEVYVRPFPLSADSGKWLVSNGSGYQPRWPGDGKELFYISADSKWMAADAGPASNGLTHRWDVSKDGRRFLINRPVEETAVAPITVVVNWREMLKSK